MRAIGDIASTWLKGRNEKIRAEAETKIAQVKSKAVIAQKQATGEIELQQSLTEQMGDSWKDELDNFDQKNTLCCVLPSHLKDLKMNPNGFESFGRPQNGFYYSHL